MLKLYDPQRAPKPDRQVQPLLLARQAMALAQQGARGRDRAAGASTDKTVIAPAGAKGRDAGAGRWRASWIDRSWTIAEHLEDQYPDRPSLFGGGAGRALTRFYQGWTDAVLHGALFPDAGRSTSGATPPSRTGNIFAKAARSGWAGPWRPQHPTARRGCRALRDEPCCRSAWRCGRKEIPRRRAAALRRLYRLRRSSSGRGRGSAISSCHWRLIDPVANWRGRMLDLYGGLAAKSKGLPGLEAGP